MVFYESFNIKGVDWENFGDLDKVLIKGGYWAGVAYEMWSHLEVRLIKICHKMYPYGNHVEIKVQSCKN